MYPSADFYACQLQLCPQVAIAMHGYPKAFSAAVDVLTTRLEEVPAIADAILERLDNHPVEFRVSEDITYDEGQPLSFSLESMLVAGVERDAIAENTELLRKEVRVVKSL